VKIQLVGIKGACLAVMTSPLVP